MRNMEAKARGLRELSSWCSHCREGKTSLIERSQQYTYVNMPPQPPGPNTEMSIDAPDEEQDHCVPGQECLTTSNLCASVIFPTVNAPERSVCINFKPMTTNCIMLLAVGLEGVTDIDMVSFLVAHCRTIFMPHTGLYQILAVCACKSWKKNVLRSFRRTQ